MIEEIFAPGRKHVAEERKRLELTRVDVDGVDPGRGPIDLASGKVTIRVPTRPDESAAPGAGTPPTDRAAEVGDVQEPESAADGSPTA